MPNYDMNSLGTYTKGRFGIRVDNDVTDIVNGADPIFEIFSGPVKVNLMFGIVTTIIAGAGCTLALNFVGTNAAHSCALSAASADFDTDAVGTLYIPPATAAGAITTIGGAGLDLFPEWILPPGEIDVTGGAAGTGVIKWSLFYVPLVEGAYVLAHA